MPFLRGHLGAGGLTGLTVAALTLVASGCGTSSDYGANFEYPNTPPVPDGAIVVVRATGHDDDDPMRGREVVIETGSTRQAELLEFYDEQFPSTAGWLQGTPDDDVGGGHLVCLARHSDKRFDEYLEIYPYDGDEFKSSSPNRYIVSISRLYVSPEWGKRTANRCGLASIWFPMDL
jgi:hypothetical protein